MQYGLIPARAIFYRSLFGLVYLVSYVILDRLSFLHPLASFGITPWNPQTGLSFAMVLIMGRRYIPWLFAGPLFADFIVRDFPFSPLVELASVMAIGGGYTVVLWHLTRPQLKFDSELSTTRDLMLFLGYVGIGAAAVALLFAVVLSAGGHLAWHSFGEAVERYWIGDVIGTVVLAPFLMVLAKVRRLVSSPFEIVAGILGVSFSLWIIFGFVESQEFHLFYLLFIPILWMALRGGMESVTIGILYAQIGLIIAAQVSSESDVRVTAIQFLMLALAVTGLATGALVDERVSFQNKLRLHHDALARIARLGSMSEVAAVLAHELNQPLTAIGNYIGLVRTSVKSGDTRTASIAAEKASDQIERAAEVIRKLRDLIRLGRSEVGAVRLESIVSDVTEICLPAAKKAKVALTAKIPSDLPPLLADMLQVEQVLQNLVTNSIEAISESKRTDGAVMIFGRLAPDAGFVEVCVKDNGPGFSRDIRDIVFLPFVSEKKAGTGLGLSLSRTIIENHGGSLRLDNDPEGAVVCFTLPIAGTNHG